MGKGHSFAHTSDLRSLLRLPSQLFVQYNAFDVNNWVHFKDCSFVQLQSMKILANNGIPLQRSTYPSTRAAIVYSKADRQYLYSIGLCKYGLVFRNVVHAFLSNKPSPFHKPMLSKVNTSYPKH